MPRITHSREIEKMAAKELAQMLYEDEKRKRKNAEEIAKNTLKEFIKEPFISDFKITARELFNEIGLGDLPFADPPFQLIAKWVAVRSFDEIAEPT